LLFDHARIRGARGVRSNLARTAASAAATATLALAVSGLFGLAIRGRPGARRDGMRRSAAGVTAGAGRERWFVVAATRSPESFSPGSTVPTRPPESTSPGSSSTLPSAAFCAVVFGMAPLATTSSVVEMPIEVRPPRPRSASSASSRSSSACSAAVSSRPPLRPRPPRRRFFLPPSPIDVAASTGVRGSARISPPSTSRMRS
jgi:hypothetical protein